MIKDSNYLSIMFHLFHQKIYCYLLHGLLIKKGQSKLLFILLCFIQVIEKLMIQVEDSGHQILQNPAGKDWKSLEHRSSIAAGKSSEKT